VHQYTEETEQLAQTILNYVRERAQLDPVPLDGPKTEAELSAAVGQTITPGGLGARAMEIFRDELAPAIISVDHPRFLSFIPSAPTEAAALFELVVGGSCIYGGSWLEAAGAVYAENQALRWVADLAGMPEEAGGTFVQGGTLGTLAALVTARHTYLERHGRPDAGFRLAAGAQAHSSVTSMARVIDCDVLLVPTQTDRMTGDDLAKAFAQCGSDGVFAVVATAGTTNLGIVDDLNGIAEVCAEHGLWLHVDGAYGAAALAAPSSRDRFAGIERCDSFTVDPHKWLFAPFDCCALVYRKPELARAALGQRAGYLDPVETGDWNPSDYAVNLSRRARGLPFWFSLATHGTDAYTTAIEQTLTVARAAAAEVERRRYVELVCPPDLSVVAFRRIGWTVEQYAAWSDKLLRAGVAFVTPSSYRGDPIARFAIVNPRTSDSDITLILDTMA
jgi:L-2,4-diaminobutyrate decarboxylase